ncbi:hypothetical protein [Arundinibacter roseus]|uniref:Uncharacterized protein n=1 Tax=Arundinibacter roseus TaxID=2070510 RepID=A0A4R4K776_9BACT|nr:hypothetical protein [Arundinibacter roseus]TDB63300.1 hypothetical protein EZE20_16125 [Arundinibacter roseus]
MRTLEKKTVACETSCDLQTCCDCWKNAPLKVPLKMKKRNENGYYGGAERKDLRQAYWSPFLNRNFFMKNYLESIALAGKNYCIFLIDNPWTTFAALFLGLGIWLVEFVEIYIFADFRYLTSLFLMIAYDTMAGIKRVKYLHNLNPGVNPAPNSKVFKDKTFSKITYYLIMLGSLHGLAHFQVKDQEVTVFHAFEYAALVAMMVAEFWSVQENYAAIGKKTIFLLAWQKLAEYLPSGTKKPEV